MNVVFIYLFLFFFIFSQSTNIEKRVQIRPTLYSSQPIRLQIFSCKRYNRICLKLDYFLRNLQTSRTARIKNAKFLRYCFCVSTRLGSRTAATSKMEHFVTIVNGWKLLTIYHKVLHRGCCSSPRSASEHKHIYKEAAVRRSSVKKVFLETAQNSQENTCAGVSFLIK